MAYIVGSDGKRYLKKVYSGTCLCGHGVRSHHCMVIARQDVVNLLREDVSPGACLVFGRNEDEHLGWDHCSGYVDVDEPDETIRSSWKGNRDGTRDGLQDSEKVGQDVVWEGAALLRSREREGLEAEGDVGKVDVIPVPATGPKGNVHRKRKRGP